MIAETVKDQLEARYNKVETIGRHIYKVCDIYKNNVFSVRLFDCTESFLSSEFNIDLYQDELLANDFYQYDNDIQWNYYLYLIYKNKEKFTSIPKGKLDEILYNKSFARKYVTNITELKKIPQLQIDREEQQPHSITIDLVSTWESNLIDKGLADVIDPKVNYSNIVPRYLKNSGGQSEIRKSKSEENDNEVKEIKKIEKVIIEKFRRYPVNEDSNINSFDFGKVTLIEGKNGSGKTSLLEAIEVWACGRCFRDENSRAKTSKIGIFFDGDSELQWNAKTEKVFKDRDMQWYRRYSKKPSSDLYRNFNRFNFFDTDTGARLSYAPEEHNSVSIKEAISNLVFGEDFSVLKERMEKALIKFKTELRVVNKDYSLISENIKQNKNIVKIVEDPKNDKEAIYNEFISHIKEIGWVGVTPSKTKLSLAKFSRTIKEIENNLIELRESLSWIRNISISAITTELNDLDKAIERLQAIDNLLEQLDEKNSTISEEKEKVIGVVDLLNEYLPYVSNKNIQSLKGLDKRIGRLAKEIEDIRFGTERYEDDYANYFEEKSVPISEIAESLDNLLIERQHNLAKLNERYNSLKQEIDYVTILLSEIRSSAENLYEIKEDIDQCPLCFTKYSRKELLDFIRKEHPLASSNDALKSTHSQITKETKLLNACKEKREILDNIIYSYQTLHYNTSFNNLTLAQLIKSIDAKKHKLNKLSGDLTSLSKLKNSFESSNLSEEKFVVLERKIKKLEKQYSRKFTTESQCNGYLELLQKDIGTKQESIDKNKNEQKNLLKEAEQITKKALKSKDYNEDLVYERYNYCADAHNVFTNISKHIENTEKYTLGAIQKMINKFISASESYLSSVTRIDEYLELYKSAKSYIDQNEKKKEELKAKQDKLGKAITILEKQILEADQDKHLDEFFENNSKQIIKAFTEIHSPREFNNVEFQENNIMLHRGDKDTKCTVEQISSGQRSALALSLFLTMNAQLDSGPPFILFDDPVTYVDDLNLLSFFDYLREIVLVNDRQILFATANSKIASIFKKKFSFLGDEDFKFISLNREYVI